MPPRPCQKGLPVPDMPEISATVSALLAAYLLGSIPSAQLFARLRGKDIFATGSGNMGTMNALRNLGPVTGVLTFALDVLKGVAAMLLAGWLAELIASGSALAGDLALAAAAIGAGLGHVFPLFTGFRGGKALAVAVGVLLPGYWQVAVAGIIVIGLLVLLTRNVNLATLITVVAAGAAVLIIELDAPSGLIRASGMLLLVVLIAWRHLPLTASARNPLVSDR